jgi:hypothetical protein
MPDFTAVCTFDCSKCRKSKTSTIRVHAHDEGLARELARWGVRCPACRAKPKGDVEVEIIKAEE